MPVLYIASDRHASGRTALAASIASALRQEGTATLLAKPLYLQEGDTLSGDPDAEDYRRLGLPLASEPTPATPADLANGLTEQLRAVVEQSLQSTGDAQHATIVEGLPGLDAESPVAHASQEMAALLDARVVVVVAFTPELTGDSLARAHRLFGERLLGVVINGVSRYQGQWVRTHLVPSVEAQGGRVVGALPEDRRLLAIRVRDIAQELQGEMLSGEEQADELVEHLMVGANVLDDSVLYFEQRANKAVVVRGDRPDIQMGALATPTACLVLTGGKEPVQYVEYEAEQEEVPIVRVPQPTLEAAQILDNLIGRTRFDHPRKLERFQELLKQHLDWETLREGLRS